MVEKIKEVQHSLSQQKPKTREQKTNKKDNILQELLSGDVEIDWKKKLGFDELRKMKRLPDENSQEQICTLPLEEFDFKKWAMKKLKSLVKLPERADDLRTVFPSDKVIIKPAHEHTIEKDETFYSLAQKYHISQKRIENANPQVKDPTKLKLGQVVMIPESVNLDMSKIETFEDIVEAVGISREFINDFMEHIEVQNVKDILHTYYDNVEDGKKGKGTPTNGYGHTGLVRGEKITDTTEITHEEAIQYLALDLFNCKIEAIAHLGQDFLDAPKSIQEGIVDNFFNKGWEKGFVTVKNSPSNKIPEGLKLHDYLTTTENLIYKTDNLGLKKRMVYRIIHATKDLSVEDRRRVLDARRDYFDEVVKQLNQKGYKKECEYLINAWNRAYQNGECNGYFD